MSPKNSCEACFRKKAFFRTVFASIAMLSVSACGGSAGIGEGTAPPLGAAVGGATINSLGIVNIHTSPDVEQNGSGETTTVSASFLGFSEPVPITTLDDIQEGLTVPRLEACDVGTLGYTDEFDLLEGLEFSSEFAGDVIPIGSYAGSWAQLNHVSVMYEMEPDSLPGALPDGASIDIPGYVFPAFPSMLLPQVSSFEYLQIENVEDNQVTGESVIVWNAGDDGSELIEIQLSGTNTLTQETVYINCKARNDGIFGFPTVTKQHIIDGEYLVADLAVYRSVAKFEVIDDALLMIVTRSTRGFSEGTSP